jgi:hypothetical protein
VSGANLAQILASGDRKTCFPRPLFDITKLMMPERLAPEALWPVYSLGALGPALREVHWASTSR